MELHGNHTNGLVKHRQADRQRKRHDLCVRLSYFHFVKSTYKLRNFDYKTAYKATGENKFVAILLKMCS